MPQEFRPIRAVGCAQPELRQFMQDVAENFKRFVEPLVPYIQQGNINIPVPIENITNNNDEHFARSVIASYKLYGVLDDELVRGVATSATMSVYDMSGTPADSGDNVEVYGWLIPSGFKLPVGARIKVEWDGYRWQADVTDTCVVPA